MSKRNLIHDAKVKRISHIINCDDHKMDTQPYHYDYDDGVWYNEYSTPVEGQLPNRVRGKFTWELARVSLYPLGEGWNGRQTLEKVKDLPALTDHVARYLMKHKELIPNEWRGKYVFFFGTIYYQYYAPFDDCNTADLLYSDDFDYFSQSIPRRFYRDRTVSYLCCEPPWGWKDDQYQWLWDLGEWKRYSMSLGIAQPIGPLFAAIAK